MPSRVCPTCSTRWPDGPRYSECPSCGVRTNYRVQVDPELSPAEAHRRRVQMEFSRRYAEREAERITSGEPTPEDRSVLMTVDELVAAARDMRTTSEAAA